MDAIFVPQLRSANDIHPLWAKGVETERLLLRPLNAASEANWLALHQDPDVARYIIGPKLTGADIWRDLAFVLGHSELRGFSMWGVYEKASAQFLGRVGPWMPSGWPGLEVGWAFAAHGRGKGYATEAVRASVGWVFDTLDVPAIIHSIQPDNEASKRLALRLGAQLLGTADISDVRHDIWVTQRTGFIPEG